MAKDLTKSFDLFWTNFIRFRSTDEFENRHGELMFGLFPLEYIMRRKECSRAPREMQLIPLFIRP